MSQPDNSTKVSTWMLSAPPKVWVVQSIGAVAFSTVVLGTAVLGPERRTALHFYSAFSIAVVVCTIFLSVLCGRLWRARLRLIVTGVIVVVTSYLMGWLSMIAANAGQYIASPTGSLWAYLKGQIQWSVSGSLFSCFIFLGWSAVIFVFQFWNQLHTREESLLRVEYLAREAELKALRQGLTPHFLLNTLNGISTLVGEERNYDARTMIALLGDFLRATLATAGSGDVTIEHEMHLVKQYLAIEQWRFSDKLSVSFNVDPSATEALIPNLLLQPLIENAVIHGAMNGERGPSIDATIKKVGSRTQIVITNAVRAQNNVRSASCNGYGLELTKDRLQARYGQDCSLDIETVHGKWKVSIDLPFQTLAGVSP